MSTDTPRDIDLDQLLTIARALRQHYRAVSQDEPPSALDEAIRAAARREVRALPRAARPGFGPAWRVPASIAAVVVLSLTVTVMVVQHDRYAPVVREQPMHAPSAGARASRVQAQPPPSDRPMKERPDAGTANSALQVLPQKGQPPGPSVPPQAAPDKLERSMAPRAESKAAAPAMESREEGPRPQAPAQAALPAPAAAGAVGANAGSPQAPPEGVGNAAADRMLSAQPLAKKPARAGLAQSPWENDPQTWLAHIDELRAAGRTDDAQASFQAFRNRYPDYQLPPGFVTPGP